MRKKMNGIMKYLGSKRGEGTNVKTVEQMRAKNMASEEFEELCSLKHCLMNFNTT